MECKNLKCRYRMKNGYCSIFEDSANGDMSAEEFIENNTCGWLKESEE